MMKLYLLRVSCPSVYTIASNTQQEAREQAAARFKRERNNTWLEPEVEIVSEEEMNLRFWDSVDAAIDDYKERVL
jgi:hypothetical protein